MNLKQFTFEDGTDIVYRTISGPPQSPSMLVLGGIGDSHLVVARLCRELRTTHSLIIVDNPGFSTGAIGRLGSPFSLDYLARCIHTLLSRETDAPVTIVAWSFGTQVAFALNKRYPEQIHSIVCISGNEQNPFGGLTREQIKGAMDLQSTFPAATGWLTEKTRNLLHLKNFLKKAPVPSALAIRFGLASPDIHRLSLDAVVKSFIMTSPAVLNAYVHAIVTAVPFTRGLRTDLPILTMVGERDKLVSLRRIKQRASRRRHTDYFEVRGGTHFVPLEYPNVMATVIHDFLKRHQ